MSCLTKGRLNHLLLNALVSHKRVALREIWLLIFFSLDGVELFTCDKFQDIG
jgi:hypothetical protein